MAASAQVTNLKEEATCSICLEYFTDPVTIDCGHNFCCSCIMECWEGRDNNLPCPQCRDLSSGRNLRPNRQLRNIVEMVKQLHLAPVNPPQENMCEKHNQELLLFCEEDQTLLCVVCDRSKEHRSHSVSPIEEAAEEYKVKLQDWLCPMRKEVGYILESNLRKQQQINTLRNKVRAEKEDIASEIEQLRQLLRHKEQTLTGRLEEMEKSITMAENANISKMSNQINSLNALIRDLEKKCKEPALDLLKEVKSTLDRCKKVQFQGPEQHMKETTEKGTHFEIMKMQKPEEEMKNYKVMVTLDPDTANPWLLLSEGCRRARWTHRPQTLPDTPERFAVYSCVLGSEGFTSGRHYWEVQILQEGRGWTVGVAAQSMNRKEEITESPEGGVWGVDFEHGQFKALTYPKTPLYPREMPVKLGVYLEYDAGRLSMYNANSLELLYTYPRTLFTEKMFPIFGVGGGELVLV
ncbi:E3 ubiquitin-protein ligase TRIM39-like [Lissotriton helveticus]